MLAGPGGLAKFAGHGSRFRLVVAVGGQRSQDSNTERLSAPSSILLCESGRGRPFARPAQAERRAEPASRPLRAAARWPAASLDAGAARRCKRGQAGTKKRRGQPNKETDLLSA